eukprot:tig00000430_g588.t1
MSGPLPPIRTAQPAPSSSAAGSGADAYARGPDGRTALISAAAAGDARACAQLLDRGADPAAVDRAGRTALFYALSAGHADAALRLIEGGASLEHLYPAPWRALHRAAQLGDLDTARRLLREKSGYDDRKGGLARYAAALLLDGWEGSGAQAGEKEWRGVLRAAGEGGDPAALRLALERAPAALRSGEGEGALHGAALAARLASLRYLVEEAGHDPSAPHPSLGPPLACAARNGHVDALKYLDERAAAAAAGSRDGDGAGPQLLAAARRRALREASGRGHVEACRYLLGRLAAAEGAAGEEGQSPVEAACAGGHAQVLQLLLSSGADLAPCRVASAYKAAEGGHLEILRALAAAGVSVRTKFIGGQGGTPLHAAASRGDAACVHLLLELGARPSAHDARGATPLHVALAAYLDGGRRKADEPSRNYDSLAHPDRTRIRPVTVPPEDPDGAAAAQWLWDLLAHRRRETVGLLLHYPEAAAAADVLGNTPLHVAVRAGMPVDVVRPLLESPGADPNAANLVSRTPLDYAVEAGDPNVVRLLIERGADPRRPQIDTANDRVVDRRTQLHVALSLSGERPSFDAARLELLGRAPPRHAPPRPAPPRRPPPRPGRIIIVGDKARAGDPPLVVAIASHRARGEPAARALVELGADVNGEGPQGTPLTLAVRFALPEAFVRLLLERGADPNKEGAGGNLPLTAAIELLAKAGGGDEDGADQQHAWLLPCAL